MKKLLFLILVLIGSQAYSQELSLENPILKQGCATYELVEIDDWGNVIIEYTRCKDNIVLEKGKFLNGKRTGVWISYAEDGSISSMVKFSYGERIWYKNYTVENPVVITYDEGKAVRVTYELASN